MKKLFIFTLITAIPSIFAIQTTTYADEIYKWVAPDGVVHYSSKKEEPKAKLADLPIISKGDFKVGAVTGVTCDKHGGINCEVGADIDGSVICFDGHTEASARYTFHCSSPKLRISDISDPDQRGKVSVYVRNEKSIPAKDPSVVYTNTEGGRIKLKGPKELPPFEMAEFTMHSAVLAKLGQKPEYSQFEVSCKNCQ